MFNMKLNSIYSSLTYSETLVADYLLANRKKLQITTSYELAKLLGVGQSTIIRFSQKLGYDTFKKLLLDLMRNDDEEWNSNEIQVSESTYETNKKVKDTYFNIIDLTFESNPPERIDTAVEYLQNANKIVCFGVGSSNLFAEYLSNKLLEMGLDCYSSKDTHVITIMVKHLKENDVLLLISESGESRDVLQIASIAKKFKVKIIGLTKMAKNSLQSMADITLNTVKFETDTRLNVTAVRCSQLYLIDILYLSMFKRNYATYRQDIIESEKLLEKEMNVKNKKNKR